MKENFFNHLKTQLQQVDDQGLYKDEREISTPQGPRVSLASGAEVINLCSNNYLGLSDHPELAFAAKEGLETYGFGLSSVRFICGTLTIHRQLESKLSQFLETEDTILYGSCFDANGGLFATLLTGDDAVISDELNHASIIDGIRLSKARRLVYRHSDMGDLEDKLKEARSCRYKMIATDGVFSMDGDVAHLSAICDLADQYGALVMCDDCHGTAVIGATGKGSLEQCGVLGRVDILTSTLGKALGGATGGFTSGRKEIIEWLRQRSRPYLFSNSVAPPVVAASLKALDLVAETDLLKKLSSNTKILRSGLEKLGFHLVDGSHPIIPVLLGDAKLAQKFSQKLLERGVFAIGFFFPVVPKGKARIRTQVSAAHTAEELETALDAFGAVGKDLGVIP